MTAPWRTSRELDGRLQAICDEYAGWPGLRLTLAQAQRLWHLDPPTALTLLEELVARRILKRLPDGRYVRIDRDLVA